MAEYENEGSHPDVIVVHTKHEEEVEADHAFLHVTVEGSSLVTGRAALDQAKEVARLVQALAEAGLERSSIFLRGARSKVSGGLLGRSSSAVYQLRIRCGDMSSLPSVLGVVTTQKGCALSWIEWGFPEDADAQARWLGLCADASRRKARAMAEALGVRIAGVHRATEQPFDAPVPGAYPVAAAQARGSGGASVDMGFELTHTKKVGIRLLVEYRIEDPGTGSPQVRA